METSSAARKGAPEDFRYHVFLSYRNPDQAAVAAIANKLRDVHKLNVWWDAWCAQPGQRFQDSLADGLNQSWATAVFIGPNTVGGWQDMEIQGAINKQVQSRKPVMAVFLPHVDPDKVEIPLFLSLNTRVVFKASTDEDDALNRLVWGITGKNPFLDSGPAPARPEDAPVDAAAIENAVTSLSSWLTRSGKVTFFIGPAACRIDPVYPPRDFEVAGRLLRDLGEMDPNLVLPLEVAANLYGIKKEDPVLEEAVVDQIAGRSSCIPPIHENLALLLDQLSRMAKPRGRRPEKQLILTTNLDLMIERALVRAEIGFTRVVQHKSERKLHVISFPSVRASRLDFKDIDDIVYNYGAQSEAMAPEAVTGTVLTEPILYKIRGSQDLPGSCALSRPQLLALARNVIADKLVPDELIKIAQNTYIVFLGTGFLAPDFQYLANTILFDAWQSDYKKFLIQVPPTLESGDPYRRIEAGIWPELKSTALRKNLTTVEEEGDRFLNRLLARLMTP